MDPGGVVQCGVGYAPDGSCLLHMRANGREGNDEVVEGLVEGGTRVSDGEGDELHPSPLFP